MDSQRRKKLIIAIIILVIISVLFLILRLGREPFIPTGQPPEPKPVFKAPSTDLEYRPVAIAPISDVEFSVLNLAKSYASRLGSWSTDNQGHNLQELEPLSSVKMKEYLTSIPRQLADKYSGITTKSISAEILSLENTIAEVLVNTQRIETDADLKQNVYYQDIKIFLVRGGAGWLVDQAQWQDKK